MEETSEYYKKAAEAIREVYRKGDSEELLALRYIAGTLADEKTIQERETASQQVTEADPEKRGAA